VCLNLISKALLELRNYDDALEAVNAGLNIKPNDENLLSLKGQTLFDMKKYNVAAECYRKIFQLNPNNIIALNELGICEARIGNYQNAIDCYQQIIHLKGNELDSKELEPSEFEMFLKFKRFYYDKTPENKDDSKSREIMKSSLISPSTPFANDRNMEKILHSCEEYIHWIDKYFSKKGLDLLYDSFDRNKVKNVKILTSIPTTNTRLKDSFIRFREEMEQSGVICELRVMTDKSLSDKIHDRWLFSRNANYNLPSPDIVERGQYSEIKETKNSIPFETFWERSCDIIDDWDTIYGRIQEYQKYLKKR
jgi:tetratricopeptide (TPR) repeat protein